MFIWILGCLVNGMFCGGNKLGFIYCWIGIVVCLFFCCFGGGLVIVLFDFFLLDLLLFGFFFEEFVEMWFEFFDLFI